MNHSIIYRQYVWLINKLICHKQLSLRRINSLWVSECVADGNALARSTFNRFRTAIEDMFGITIECDKANDNQYYISNLEDLENDDIAQWLLSTLTVNYSLADCKSIHERIILETIMSTSEMLTKITKALKSNLKIKIGYRRFGADNYEVYIAPYALKLFNKRWYVLANNGKWLSTYSLDRITKIELTEDKFTYPDDFSPKQYFADFYGIITDDTPVANVVIRAYGKTPYYLRSLPLHHSQKEIDTADDHTDFSLTIRPTYDFIMQLLHYGTGIEVLKPTELRERIKEEVDGMHSLYK